MKRIISLFLSLAMVLSMLPAQVFATGTESETETTPAVETTAPATQAPEETEPAETETVASTVEETAAQAETETRYSVTWEYNPEHMQVEGEAWALEGQDYTAKITLNKCCYVASNGFKATIGSLTNAARAYNKDTGEITVFGHSIYDNIVITIETEVVHGEYEVFEEPGESPTCTEKGYYQRVTCCAECGERLGTQHVSIPVVDHVKGELEILDEPTCLNYGLGVYLCQYGCGTGVEYVELDKVDHIPGEPVLEGERYNTYCTGCGTLQFSKYALTQQEAAEKMLKLVNDLRQEHGLKPLVLSQKANDLAVLRSEELHADFSHSSAGGYNQGYGENIAMRAFSAEELFESWCDSPGHLANMLYEHYEEFGFGYSLFGPETGGYVAMYGTQLFSYHKDADRDHTCENGCDVFLGEHKDDNGDHKCDYGCAEPLGQRYDSPDDGDHLCDCGCGEVLEECTDIDGDGDHTCDICGAEWASGCYGGTATCLNGAKCEECGLNYGETDNTYHESSDYIYTVNDNGTHSALRACCKEVVAVEGHSYTEGVCVCAKAEPLAAGQLEQLYWELESSGKLTLSGSGAMEGYAAESGAPWYEYRAQITSVEIRDGVTSVGSYAFAELSGVTALSLPDSITSIGQGAFYGCGNLQSLSFPASARVEKNAFLNCRKLSQIAITPGTGDMCDYDENTCLYLPWNQTTLVSVRVNQGVRRIGNYAFCGAASVKSVQLPNTLTRIGDYAFRGSPLSSLTLYDGLTEIGAYALADMDSLSTVTIPDTVTQLGSYALSGSMVKAVELSTSLTKLPKGLFYNCEKLNTVVIPDGVRVLEEDAFRGCRDLYGINVPEGVTELGNSVFRNCGLNNIKLPDSLTSIGEYAFALNDHLTKMTIPSGVRRIGQFAFAWCEWIDTLIVQSWDLTIEANAFYDCTSCHTVYFSGNSRLWNVAEGESGVHIVYSPGYDEGGNSCLIYADVHSASQYTPVQEVHILDVDGLFGPKGAVLDGGIIPVDLNKVKSIKLRYQVLPEDADFPEITWTSDEWYMTDSKVDKNEDLILTKMVSGEMTVYAQNFDEDIIDGLNKDPYTYTTASVRFVFSRQVTSISISGDYFGYALLNTPISMTAKVLPNNADDLSVRWSVENLTGKAVIDQNGQLTGTKCGSVCVRAEAADGSGVVAEKYIAICEYEVELTGADQVVAGKAITLKASLIPFNMTNTSVKWKLKDPADSAYVTLSGGKLTARKNLAQRRQVTVVAYAADGKALEAEKTVLLIPLTNEVTISMDGAPAAGKTLVYDLNDPQRTGMTLTAEALPADAGAGIDWTGVNNKYAEIRVAGGKITLSNPTGKTGTITLTAKANDGSGKKATVKVQFVRLAQSVEVLDAPRQLRGGSKVTLKTNVAGDKTLTDKNILWSLSDDSLPYAAISAKGVLTTRAVSVPVTITVYAQVKANPDKQTKIQIQLVPGAVEPQIRLDDKLLTKGETIYVDLANPKVTLTGSTLPVSAIQSGSWKNSSASAAELVDNKDGTATVTMKKVGSTTITFTAGDDSKKSISIKLQAVLPVKTIGLYTKDDQHELNSGKTLQISTKPSTAQAGVKPTVKKFTWTVSDPTAATVSSSGKVKALTVYRNTPVTVTATAMDGSGVQETYDILIKPAKEETLFIRLGEENITGTTRYFHAVFDGVSELPQEKLSAWVYNSTTGEMKEVTPEITVSGKSLYLEGMTVSPKAYGKSTVTVKYGKKLSAKVTYQVVRKVDGITLTSKTGADWVLAGKSLQLTAAVTNKDATIKKFAWSVDDTSVATVSASGKLTARVVYSRKTVTVTARATDGSGVQQSFPVTIYPAATGITIKNTENGMVMNNRTLIVYEGVQTGMTLEAIVHPSGEAGARNQVTFSGGNKAVKVNADGTLEFIKRGTVTVKVTANDGSKVTASFKIIVK